ncbi:RSPO2 protein, partial [Atractosteus spatula]|nr:RSPO2 protein [Atractosteus spatula]
MQFRLFSFALIVLNCMEYSHCQSHRWKRNKRASYGPYPICKGCSVCSKDNGCLSCQPRLFLFLRREGMRQYGECLHACPSGFYGLRAPEMNICSRCRIENCDSCFSKDFCTKCKSGFYLHKGRCFEECPEGFAPLEDSMECGVLVNQDFNRSLLISTVGLCSFGLFLCLTLILSFGKKNEEEKEETILPFLILSCEGCEVGPWSEWGTCTRRNRTCGFKWGLETRTRHIVKKPPKDTIPCPTIAESRRCKMAMRHCTKDKKQRTKDQKKKTNNKQRLRVRAQKQHSDHLATGRASQ